MDHGTPTPFMGAPLRTPSSSYQPDHAADSYFNVAGQVPLIHYCAPDGFSYQPLQTQADHAVDNYINVTGHVPRLSYGATDGLAYPPPQANPPSPYYVTPPRAGLAASSYTTTPRADSTAFPYFTPSANWQHALDSDSFVSQHPNTAPAAFRQVGHRRTSSASVRPQLAISRGRRGSRANFLPRTPSPLKNDTIDIQSTPSWGTPATPAPARSPQARLWAPSPMVGDDSLTFSPNGPVAPPQGGRRLTSQSRARAGSTAKRANKAGQTPLSARTPTRTPTRKDSGSFSRPSVFNDQLPTASPSSNASTRTARSSDTFVSGTSATLSEQ
jgi:hypothetical protein